MCFPYVGRPCNLLSPNGGQTVTKIIEKAAELQGDKCVFTYLDVKGKEIENQSMAEVVTYMSRIGAYLQREMGLCPGDRAVLLYPPGHEFILAFLVRSAVPTVRSV